MAAYKIIKFCRFCRQKFVVSNKEARKIYCDDCQEKINKDREENKDEGKN